MPIQKSGPISIDDIRAELGQTTGNLETLMETHSALLKFDNRYANPPGRTSLTDNPKSIGEYYGYGNLGEIRGIQGRDGANIIQHAIYNTVNTVTLDDVNVYFNGNVNTATDGSGELFTTTRNPNFSTQTQYTNPLTVPDLPSPVSIGTSVYIRDFNWTFSAGLDTFNCRELVSDLGDYCRIIVQNPSFNGNDITFETRLITTFQPLANLILNGNSGILTEVVVKSGSGFGTTDYTSTHSPVNPAVVIGTGTNKTFQDVQTVKTHTFTATLNNWYEITARVYNRFIPSGSAVTAGNVVVGNYYYVDGLTLGIGADVARVRPGNTSVADYPQIAVGGAFQALSTNYLSYDGGYLRNLTTSSTGKLVSETTSYIYF